jgi:hypothetical protein
MVAYPQTHANLKGETMDWFTRLLVFLHLRQPPATYHAEALTDTWEFRSPEGVLLTDVIINVQATTAIPADAIHVDAAWTEVP